MFIDFLTKVFQENPRHEAIIWKNRAYSYAWLLERVSHWRRFLDARDLPPGSIVSLEADFSPNSVALLLAMTESACVIVPLSESVGNRKTELMDIAQCEFSLRFDGRDHVHLKKLQAKAVHPLYARLRRGGHPGLVVFSSGSTGKTKASVHDLTRILEKFKTPRHRLRTIAFLLFDHLGGLNTLFYTLSNAGNVIAVRSRTPDSVLRAVEKYKAELLPVSPTFVNLIFLSEAFKRHDMSSLRRVAYGTEPMPQSVLTRLHELLPKATLLQTYGLTEVGVLRSKSKSSDSLWVKVGGEGVKTRVRDGLLQIKSKSAMLGYLNAPSPFTKDGWLETKDRVEVNGEYIKILGRDSEIINVGGEKIYPAEVEGVIHEMDNVADVTVYPEKNPIVGELICARVRLKKKEGSEVFSRRLKMHCRGKLARYKIPVIILFSEDARINPRFKKLRASS